MNNTLAVACGMTWANIACGYEHTKFPKPIHLCISAQLHPKYCFLSSGGCGSGSGGDGSDGCTNGLVVMADMAIRYTPSRGL